MFAVKDLSVASLKRMRCLPLAGGLSAVKRHFGPSSKGRALCRSPCGCLAANQMRIYTWELPKRVGERTLQVMSMDKPQCSAHSFPYFRQVRVNICGLHLW